MYVSCYFSLSPEGVQHSTCTARSLCSHWGTLHVRPCIERLSARKVRLIATTHFEMTVRTNCNLQSTLWMLVYVCVCMEVSQRYRFSILPSAQLCFRSGGHCVHIHLLHCAVCVSLPRTS